MQPSPIVLGALACAALSLAGHADAQVFTGVGTVAPAPVAKPTSIEPVLRHLPSTLEGFRISGEVGNLRWPVYLTAAQASAPLRFRLGYVSAVSVLPDSSTIQVRLNGKLVGTETIDAPEGMRTIELAIPTGLAAVGYNAVSVAVEQRHRVDCSVAATYELWTRIEPSETGLVLPPGTRSIADVADLAGLLPKADGTLPIHVVLTGKTNPAHIERLVRATQEIALAGRFQQPAVDFMPKPLDPYGIDLVLGTRAALKVLAPLAEMLGGSGPLVHLVARADARPLLVVTGSDEAEVDHALAMLGEIRTPVGTEQGLTALAAYPAYATTGGADLRLRDLGVASQEFDGRFFRKSFNLALPADFLASDYGRGTFDLAGGYAAGLGDGAQVRVDVNGRSAGIIKLPYAQGDVFRHNQLFLPLGLMRPGMNRVDVFAETPRPEDAACAAPTGKRFLFLDASEIRLPALGHVQRLPDLALTTGGSLPYTDGNAHLVVPKPDRDTMAAALSLAARAAVGAGKVVPFAFATKVDVSGDGSTLVVSPARSLDPALMAGAGVDPAEVEAAWRDLTPTDKPDAAAGGTPRWWLTNNDGPAACRVAMPERSANPTVATPIRSSAPVVMSVPAKDGDDLFDDWSGEKPKAGWGARLMAAGARVEGWIAGAAHSIRLPSLARARPDAIAPSTSLVLAQGVASGSGNVTTIVTAPNSAMLRAGVACLFDPQVWSRVHGRLAQIDGASGEVAALDATTFHYRSSGTASLANTRLVVAGWFSLNPAAFVATALMLALFLSGTTLWFVRGVGRRPE